MELPAWLLDGLEGEAERRGVSTETLVKMWLADRLEVVEGAGPTRGHAAE